MTKKQLDALKRKYRTLRADDYYGCRLDDENEFVCKSNEADALVYAMIGALTYVKGLCSQAKPQNGDDQDRIHTIAMQSRKLLDFARLFA